MAKASIMKQASLKIVIPCLAETGIMKTVESLLQNNGFQSSVECLIVVNHAESESGEIKHTNQLIVDELHHAQKQINTESLKFLPIETFNLPHKKAGVGLARKIGMDLAVQQLKKATHFEDGIIVCLDGDCTVQENYLASIETYFNQNKANGCSIHFEHPLDYENAQAIIDYELFLRYYTNALRWCGFPYAYQTVGSSMAVSASAYEKQGGMNTRKAGEDFYFLNKIIPLGKFGDLTTTTVFPSARRSQRVPFGTGREMIKWDQTQQLLSYSPDLFIELKKVLNLVALFWQSNAPVGSLEDNKIHASLISHLIRNGLNDAVIEANANTSSSGSFQKRFFVWLNAFRIMKLLNELSGSEFPKVTIQSCGTWLWREMSDSLPETDPRGLLMQFRKWDRTNPRTN
jgi:hypothetical protein